MVRTSCRRGSGETGQVLLVGIIMLLTLLIALFFLFDLHNVMRAKFKTETYQSLPGARVGTTHSSEETVCNPHTPQ